MAKPTVAQNPPGAYVYEIVVDGIVRYVGKGRGRRHKVHLQIARRINRERQAGRTCKALKFHNRLAKSLIRGAAIEVRVVLSGVDDETAFAKEIELISAAAPAQLWNEAPGGEGLRSDYARALWQDPDYREKRRILHARPEFRERQRQGAVQQFASEQAREANRERSKSMWANPEFRARGEQMLRQIWDDEGARDRHKDGVRKFRDGNPETVAGVTEALGAYNKQPAIRARRSAFFKAAWSNEEFRAKATAHWNNPKRKREIVEGWTPEFLASRGKAISEGFRESEKAQRSFRDPEKLAKLAEGSKRHWRSPEARAAQSARMKALWQDPEHRAKTTAHWAVKRKARDGA